MTNRETNSGRSRQYPTLQRIDIACDVFEAKWLAGERPDLATHLESVAENDRTLVFPDLLHLDIEYRQQAGEDPIAADYLDSLPLYRSQILDVFGQLQHAPAESVHATQLSPHAGASSVSSFAKTEFFSQGKLGAYLLLEKIGEGGMGAVYKARHTKLKRVVAIKVLPQDALRFRQAVDRFEREMEVIGALDHPNIVRALDAGEADGTPYLAMEYVHGEDLARLVKQHGPFPLAEALDCIRQVAIGLSHAHRQGIVHRDIKPANLLLDNNGTIKILDLGLARLEAEVSHHSTALQLTQTGQVMGTYDYMSPEQALQTHSVDYRTDIYSLGCTLFVLLTGRSMFPRESPVEKVLAHRTAPAPSLCEHCPAASAAVEDLFQKMVAKQPEDRIGSMDEVVAAIDACLGCAPRPDVVPAPIDHDTVDDLQSVTAVNGPTVPVATSTAVPVPPTPIVKPPNYLAIVAAAAVLLLLVGAWFVWSANNIGQLRIDSFDPALQVQLIRYGTPLETFASGDRLDFHSYPAGEYEVRLADPNEMVQIEGGKFKLARGARHWVRVVPLSVPQFLTSPRFTWTKPQNLDLVNSSLNDAGPALLADECTLLFSSEQRGSNGLSDLWTAKRESRDKPWGPALNLGGQLNSEHNESYPELSADGLTLIFASDRPDGWGSYDLWQATRAAIDQPWSPPENMGEGVNGPNAEMGAALSADGLTLIFASQREIGSVGNYDLWQATRSSTDKRFEKSVNMGTAINSIGVERSPALSADGNVLLFASTRPGGAGHSDLWIATRTAADQPWQEPVNIGEPVNQAGNEYAARLSADGHSLYFSSTDRDDNFGAADIYVSHRVPRSQLPAEEPPPAVELVEQPPPPIEPSIKTPPLAVAPFDFEQGQAHQKAWADYLQVPVERQFEIYPAVKVSFVLIPPGEYWRGTSTDDALRLIEETKKLSGDDSGANWRDKHDVRIKDEKPQHLVTITKPFYFMKYEPTQVQLHHILGSPQQPPENELLPGGLGWDMSKLFIDKLNEQDPPLPWEVHFPTEAQWEYACRAGSTTDYCFGNDQDKLKEYAWFGAEGGRPHPVGQLKPNAYGLYDIHGNLGEWVEDIIGYDQYAKSGRYDPPPPLFGVTARVFRGGCWDDIAINLRSAARRARQPEFDFNSITVRLVLTPRKDDFSLLRETEDFNPPPAAEQPAAD